MSLCMWLQQTLKGVCFKNRGKKMMLSPVWLLDAVDRMHGLVECMDILLTCIISWRFSYFADQSFTQH